MPKMLKKGWKQKSERKELWCIGCKQFLPRERFTKEGTTSAGSTKYRSRCKKCFKDHAEQKHAHQRHRKQLLEFIDGAKQKCGVCGYDRCKAALDFHHRKSDEKDAEIADLLDFKRCHTTTLEMLKREVEKCVVLCCRCHREHHAGMLDL